MPSVVKINIEGAEFAALRGADAIVGARGRRIAQLASDDDVAEWKCGPVRLLRIE